MRLPYLCAPACGLLLAAPAGAVEWIDANFGNQPVAIGAGPRALGMGGAFSAVADDATASTWNPAGLTQCERPELAASVGFYYSYTAADGGDDEESALHPEHVSGMLPFYAFGCQQVVGVAWQRTFDFTRRVSTISRRVLDDGMGSVLDQHSEAAIARDGSFATLGLCYAIEPIPGFSVGITVNQWADRWTRASHYRQESRTHERSTLDVGGFGFTTESWFDTNQSTRILDGTSVVLGAWWQALPELTLAVVAKPGYGLDLEVATDRVEILDFGFGPSVTLRGGTTRATLHQPPMVTVGTAWRGDDVNTITCDATWTRWRQYYFEQEGERYSPLSLHTPPDDFDDLWTLRLGYERVCILPGAVVVPRCGALVEWLPALTWDAQTDDTSVASDFWWGLTAGLSVCLRSVIWDAGVQVRRGDDVGAGQFTAPDRTTDLTIITARLGVTLQF